MRMLIALFLFGWWSIVPVLSTIFPIPKAEIQDRFTNDTLATDLRAKVLSFEQRLEKIHEQLTECEGYVKPPAFTHAKYKNEYSINQINEWLAKGWTQTNEFGWSILDTQLNHVLPNWFEGFEKKVTQTLASNPDGKISDQSLKELITTEEQITDFISVQRSYIDRLVNWDEWCRKGPWLLEDSPPDRLKQEIDLLTEYLAGKITKLKFLTEFPENPHKTAALSVEDLKQCLEAKQIVYNWYHGFTKGNTQAMKVRLTPTGFEFQVAICLFGEGAREEAAKELKQGIERFWRGTTRSIPFATVVVVKVLTSPDEDCASCLKVRIGAPTEKEIWPSDTELHYEFDEETAAHEFGHAIGFRDRYRDVYDMETKTYKTYQWDLFNLMSAQNGPNPIVTEDELNQIVDAYWDKTVH